MDAGEPHALWCLGWQDHDLASSGRNTMTSNLASIPITCNDMFNGFYAVTWFFLLQPALPDIERTMMEKSFWLQREGHTLLSQKT